MSGEQFRFDNLPLSYGGPWDQRQKRKLSRLRYLLLNAARWEVSPYFELDEIQIPPKVIGLIPAEVARRHQVVPIRFEGGILEVVFGQPKEYPRVATTLAEYEEFNTPWFEPTRSELESILGYKVKAALAPKAQITRALRRFYPVL